MNNANYQTSVENARQCLSDRDFQMARTMIHQALALDPARPEAYNLMGALCEIGEMNWLEAQKFYRMALDADPTYLPARANFNRTARIDKSGSVDLGGSQ